MNNDTTKHTLPRGAFEDAKAESNDILAQGSIFVEGYEDEEGDFEPEPRLERATAPAHPGTILRNLYMPSAGISQSELAERLGVSRRTISMIVTEARPISIDMANRLARAFSTSPKFWLQLQANRDAWEASRLDRAEYEHIEPLRRAVA